MKTKKEIVSAINLLHYKARQGFINGYEASLCIGALRWVLKEGDVHTKWFKYRLNSLNNSECEANQ